MLPMISAKRRSIARMLSQSPLRRVRDVFLGARVLAVEIAPVGQQLGGWNFPGTLIFLSFVPPF